MLSGRLTYTGKQRTQMKMEICVEGEKGWNMGYTSYILLLTDFSRVGELEWLRESREEGI